MPPVASTIWHIQHRSSLSRVYIEFGLRIQFKIPAADAVCVRVASRLKFCAHSSLQSFSTSDKMKGPKTGLPGGTTFDPKRVHFWVPSEIYLLCARDQNWALSILNLVPPWGLV